MAINHYSPFAQYVLERCTAVAGRRPLSFLQFPPLFSYVGHFLAELDAISRSPTPRRVHSFCWNVGFLASTNGEPTEFESPRGLATHLHLTGPWGTRVSRRLVSAVYPKSGLELTWATDARNPSNSPPEQARLAFHVVFLEEWRHYWQSRIARLAHGSSR